jgi:hypothetical protein
MLGKNYNLIIYTIGYMLFHGIRKNMKKTITYVLKFLDINC